MPDDKDQFNSLITNNKKGITVVRKIASVIANASVALVFAGLLTAGVSALRIRAAADIPPQPHPAITVETIQVVPETSYIETSQYVGRLEPARKTALAFERPGLIVKVAKDEGDTVQKGDVVAELDIALLQTSRRQLEAQQRELQARVELAELTRRRQAKLSNKGWASQQRFDEAKASVAELTAAIDRVDEQIKSIDIDIRKSKLIAPFDGVIAARSVDEGAVVAASTPVMTVLEAAHVQARIGLPPEKAEKIEKTRTYTFRAGTHIMTGTLARLRPDLQSGTRTVTALFDITGANAVPFGEIVTLELETKIKERGTWLPLTALKEGQKGLWTVMVIDREDGKTVVHGEAAEILYAKDQQVFVRGTFKPDAAVLANGTNRVTNGQRVAIAKE